MRCGVWRDVVWFVANVVAGAVEITTQKTGIALAQKMGLEQGYQKLASGLGAKVIGLLWVLAFFFGLCQNGCILSFTARR